MLYILQDELEWKYIFAYTNISKNFLLSVKWIYSTHSSHEIKNPSE